MQENIQRSKMAVFIDLMKAFDLSNIVQLAGEKWLSSETA